MVAFVFISITLRASETVLVYSSLLSWRILLAFVPLSILLLYLYLSLLSLSLSFSPYLGSSPFQLALDFLAIVIANF